MRKLHYSVLELYQMRCDRCNKPLGYGYADYCDDVGAICSKCRKIRLIPDLKQKIKRLRSLIHEKQKQFDCGNSKKGHQFPPRQNQKPPWEKDHDLGYPYDVTTSGTFGLGGGYPNRCTKCGYTYYDPAPVINWRDNKITTIDPELSSLTHVKLLDEVLGK